MSTVSTASTEHTESGYTTSYSVEQSPEEVFAAIVDVASWWTGQIEGSAEEVGAEFTYRHLPQHYSAQLVVELEPGRRVVWRVTDSHLAFTMDPSEWTGTEIVFDIGSVADGTELWFTHVGLLPEVECFAACSTGWMHYINASLRSRITTGAGLPDPW